MLIAASAVLGAALPTAAPALRHWLGRGDVVPAAVPVVDPRFVPLGRAYLPELGRAYAAAWDEGADALESGQPVAAALKGVGQSWDGGRVELFDTTAHPGALEGRPRGAAGAASDAGRPPGPGQGAWRGLASGLASSPGLRPDPSTRAEPAQFPETSRPPHREPSP